MQQNELTSTKKPLFTKQEKVAMQLGGAIGTAIFPKNKVAGGLFGVAIGLFTLFLSQQK